VRPFSRFAAPSVVALVIGLLVAGSPAHAATTIDVHPGQSIQAAIHKAHPGDTIVVEPGVYRENVVVNKNHITLEGSGSSSKGTVLKPPANPKGPNGGTGISVYKKVDFKTGAIEQRSIGVTVTGFLVKGFRDFGIFFYGANDFVASHNKAVNNGGYGISGFHLRSGKYLYNTAVGSEEAGFYTGDSPRASFVTRGNTARGNQFGYFMRDAQHGLVTDNDFEGNCVGAVILDTGSPGPARYWTLKHNDVHQNDRFCPKTQDTPFPLSGSGIVVFGGRRNRIVQNHVWANRPSKGNPFLSGGIVLQSGKKAGGAVESANRVRGNVAYGNKAYDIRYDGAGTNHFVGNACRTSSPKGLCT